MPALSRDVYAVSAQRLARRLLGCVLVRTIVLGDCRVLHLRGRILETEAYAGVLDAGCHSFRGRRTPKNEAMYAQAGTAYVYFTYGMHCCMNVVAGKAGEPIAVLLRALEPLHAPGSPEFAFMQRARGQAAKRPQDLCSGPGKLCQAMAIGLADNQHDLCAGERLWIEAGKACRNVLFGKRIGLGTTAAAWRDAPLRFGTSSPHLSKRFDAP
jgi:DNA-3-methyladenine glycosylase